MLLFPRRSISLVRGVLAAAVTLLLGACASSTRPDAATATDPRGLAVYLSTGERVTWERLVDASSAADVVLVGENHGHPVGLPAAAALWEDILARCPRAGLALEFFERDEQVALDDYLGGVTDEAAFRTAARRSENNYPPGHRAMVEAAKAAGRTVYAANAPRRYVRIARTDGYEKLALLSTEQRRLFRAPDRLPDGPYRQAFNRVMTPGHDPSAGQSPAPEDVTRLDGAFRSQSLWDWTMAETVARGVNDQNRPMLLVIGRFHIDHEGGTVLALRELAPAARIVTVSFLDADQPTDQDKGRADFVVYVGPGPGDE